MAKKSKIKSNLQNDVSRIKALLRKKEREINDIKNSTHHKLNEITTLQNEINNIKEQLRQKEDEINSIVNSFSYKLGKTIIYPARVYKKLSPMVIYSKHPVPINNAFPFGTRRRYIAKTIAKAIDEPINSIKNLRNFNITHYFKEMQNYAKYGKLVGLTKDFLKKRKETSIDELKKIIKKTGKVVFLFPIIDWNFRFQRSQQLCRQMTKDGKVVIYFQTEIKQISENHKKDSELLYHVGVSKIEKNIFSINLISYNKLNIYKDIPEKKDVNLILHAIQIIKKMLEINESTSIVCLPFWYSIVKGIKNNKIIYDCMDEHSGFSTNSYKIIGQENKLIRKSRWVLCSSEILYRKCSSINKKTILVRNAVDYNHFTSDSENKLRNYKKPVLGYYGAISDWFDTKLVEKIAEKFKYSNIILIGHTFGCNEISKLKKRKNVHILGEKSYNDIPSYLEGFDVALIPFKINELTKATNPVKFYEYMAKGKPTVSVNLPELRQYKEYVYLSKNHEEFIENIKKALRDKDKEKKIKFASEQTWQKRYKQIRKII